MNLPVTAKQLFFIHTKHEFEQIALEVFRYQANNCAVYAKFIHNLGVKPQQVKELSKVPFLPIEFFKSHKVICGNAKPEIIFSSSGTTGARQSKHYVSDTSLYEISFLQGFHHFHGSIEQYTVLALLPSYTERKRSSLIYMVDDLMRQSGKSESGYFLTNHQELKHSLQNLKESKQPTILIGVTYALLDFIEEYPVNFPELIVMETGGMKGKRKEMIREELHETLCKGFGVSAIHSEYGMTELLSQAYSTGKGIFNCPPWMRILIRDINDPLTILNSGQTGGINVIDLANINSCSFLAAQDLGKQYADGSFEVLGRFDNSDIRGCNLLMQ